MSLRKFGAGLAAACALMGGQAQAEVLTFEDLTGRLAFFEQNYRGFKFGTNSAFDNAWFHTRFPSEFYTAKSGDKYVATDYQLYQNDPALFKPTQPITSAVDFTFDGAWFSGGFQVRYELYLNGSRVHTSADSPELGPVPVFVPSGYAGWVDSVVVVGNQGFYAMDDFTYNSTPVPEVGTLWLLMGGLVAVVFIALRRAPGQREKN